MTTMAELLIGISGIIFPSHRQLEIALVMHHSKWPRHQHIWMVE